MSFTVVTHNIQNTESAKVQQYLRQHFSQSPQRSVPPASLGVFQEFTHGIKDFEAVMPHYWSMLWDVTVQPFAIDTSEWDVLDFATTEVYGISKVGKKGAGPSRLTGRKVQWVELRRKRRNGARLHLLNLHGPPSIHVPQQPDGDISRDELHEMLMDANADKISRIQTPVILAGDFNCEWDHPNMRPLRKQVSLANNPGQGTHGNPDPSKARQIDLITYRGGVPAERRFQLERLDSGLMPRVVKYDHSGVWAQFRFTR
jgi:hypothetical protein